MKTVYYYKGVSGRVRFVTFTGTGDNCQTNERMPVKRSSVRFKTFKNLQGKFVELNGLVGRVVSCNPTDEPLNGKYRGDEKYFQHPELLNLNHLVLVHWLNGVQPGWQPFFKMKLLSKNPLISLDV